MITIQLPDGSQRTFPTPLTVAEVAKSIGSGLAKAALAGKVDGRLVDTSTLIEQDVTLALVTAKDPEGVDILRHSTAHLLAHAVKELYPEAQVTIGPVIENGFYYDFSYLRPFTPEDLERIEKRMEEIVRRDLPVQRELMARGEAVRFFEELGEKYKAEIIAAIPTDEPISLYRQDNFVDLCRGPHVPSTGKLKVFKLTRVAGAYWRGDAKNEMLTRVYGTAWATREDQETYLHRLAEAERRDHRRLGRELDLFHLQEEAPGMIFWHPKGWALWQEIEQYMRRIYRENGYQEVRCPQILDRALWEKSGHWGHFQQNMFTTLSEEREFAIKPMNCPGHVQIFNQGVRSYRELPVRYGEFGSCHRNEPSGALHGVMRVRGFTQDDGHIFCTEDQILEEVSAFIQLLRRVYADFGFTEIQYKLATRPTSRVGSEAIWDKAEDALRTALEHNAVDFQTLPGEGAFYGPKIEFHLSDSLGRTWQCGTIQADFSMPERLGATFVAADNSRQTPVMLHRAILGSLERFIGILIEHYAGALPLWLSPVQAVVANISEAQRGAVENVAQQLREEGVRVEMDLRNEKISYKIRTHSLQKIPYQLVMGDREVESGQVSVRLRGGKDLGAQPVEVVVSRMKAEILAKSELTD
ncbi:threonine--tRNA ligase [Ferrovum myxofaciens]|uniref:Threonine--tRNA ligase n=1 Tax=Ferrovum myxofaciens TaxID=416213 RepID=A0A8F3E128_9PROT|nr:threonine--tRNA ligase [Ferrovum myxofaciens]KXW57930.1 threonine--tRNA ligase [Ferrovum myxofaciens]MBU6994134.1 threonine--tRNA ligase [Ferrovum myxofaciens]QKE38076.1 MAG: threonine--tRNA ligase [Ferrovum myxofaciens]QKE40652.1 MAG: threonine--tRNA ligase [Ferrovum myxofaciens]QWY75795.1 MAG: threonine--tRNA ligase [Ferrovum myxofaciens]